MAPQFEKNHKMPPSRRDAGLLFLPDIATRGIVRLGGVGDVARGNIRFRRTVGFASKGLDDDQDQRKEDDQRLFSSVISTCQPLDIVA